jgi:polar amino acid transport system substrate-binding protein
MDKRKNWIIVLGVVALLLVLLGYYFSVQKTEITDPTLLRIKEHGKIVVGTSADYPPMESIDEKGEIVGFDIDFAREIAAHLGVSLEIKNIPFDDLFDALKKREVDMVIAAVTITPERAQEMGFSDPYFSSGLVIVTRLEDQTMKSHNDLKGKKVGVQKGTTQMEEAKKYGAKIVLYELNDPLPEDLMNNKIDAFIVDIFTAKDFIRKNPNIKIAGEPITLEFHGVAVNKEDQALLAEINKVIRNLKETGKLKELQDKWI